MIISCKSGGSLLIPSKIWSVIALTNEISEDLRRKVSKQFFKSLGSAVDEKFSEEKCRLCRNGEYLAIVTLHRSGQLTKVTSRARCLIVRGVTRNPRVMSSQLKASLVVTNVLMPTSPPSEKYWTTKVCMADLHKGHYYSKRTLLPVYS